MKKLKSVVLAIIAILALSLVVVFVSQKPDNSGTTLIRLGHGQTESNERHLACEYFKELVEERSGGKLTVEIFPNELLGSEGVMTESVSFNDLEMVAASATSQYGSIISIFELPYLFDSYQDAWEVLDSDIGKRVAEPYLKNNLRLLAYFENGFRNVTSNRLIEKPEDMKGLKIRTPEFELSLSIFKAFGANPTPMAFSELYTALQQGTVDAQENPIANIYANKFQEVQDYLVITNHQYMPIHMIISDEFWKTLSEEEQEIIATASQEAAQYHRDLVRASEESMINELKADGMEVIDVDMDQFRALIDPVYDSFREKNGSELLDEIINYDYENKEAK